MHSRWSRILALVAFVTIAVWIVWQPPTFIDKKYARQGRQTSGAMEALDSWAAQRAYPNRLIPAEGYAQAFEYSRTHLRRAAGSPDAPGDPVVDPWEAIGPHNIGGRTLCVVVDPGNPLMLWAGSASGGLWKSSTGGIGADAWDRVLTGFPVLGVSSIVIAPDDPQMILIGTGEVYGYQNAHPGVVERTTRGSYGIGILKSTDGGATWAKSLDWSYAQQRGVAWLAMHPTDHDIIYAATTEGTYKTTDGGATWDLMHDVIMSMHVVIDPDDPERVYVACGDMGSAGTGLYRTENGGGDWTRLTGGLPGSWTGKAWLDIYDAAPNVIYASLANAFAGLGLYRSVDHGDSWIRVSSADYAQYQGWFSHWVSVSPVDSSQVLCGGIDTWRSTSGGANLQRVSYWYNWYFGDVPPGGPEGPPDYVHADNHCVVRHPGDPNFIYMGTDGGVFYSTDNGQTFAGANGGFQSTQFYASFSSALSEADLSIGGFQDNATAIYHGDLGWFRCIGGDGSCTAINPLNPDIMFGSYQYLAIQRSTNGGANWSGAGSGISSNDPTCFIGPFVVSYGAPDILYAGTNRIYKTTNNAGSWFATNNGSALYGNNPALSIGISWFDPNVVYAGLAPVTTHARIFRTSDGGTSWNEVTGSLPDRYPMDIGVDPNNPSTAYVAYSGFGTPHLWRTTDMGGSWENAGADLPDVPTNAVAVDPDNPNIVYVGNDLGVYVSTNSGNTWSEFQEGMPPAMVYDLSVVYVTRTIRAATHGNGAYERPMLPPSTGVEEQGVAQGESPAAGNVVRVLPAVPNPFNPSTEIRFVLTERRPVKVWIADATGRMVTKLADDVRDAGPHAVRFEAGDLASGVYLVRVMAGDASATRKIVLAR